MTITETRPQSVFVSFAAFCSNFLLFLLLSFDRSVSSEDDDDWRTGQSPKALADDESQKPNPQSVFVSFAAFCSNFLLFLLLSLIETVQARTTTIVRTDCE